MIGAFYPVKLRVMIFPEGLCFVYLKHKYKYDFYVLPVTIAGDTIYTLQAIDPSTGSGTGLFYYIIPTDPSELDPRKNRAGIEHFSVNAVSGDVKLTVVVDYEASTISL